MRKLGIILSAYGLDEYVDACLSPWLSFNIPISCVSFQFENFEKQDNKNCLEKINKYIPSSSIFYNDSKILKEHEARNIALNDLKNKDIDTFLILDIDEFYKKEEIINLLDYINSEDFDWVAWSKINFKNYIFDGKCWTDGFCPPRVFKLQYQDFKLDRFYWDNDLVYKDDNKDVDYKYLSSSIIPKNKLHVKHMTWLNTERGKYKAEYQQKHFGKCSYKWNSEKNVLEFNKQYYVEVKEPIPQIYYDE